MSQITLDENKRKLLRKFYTFIKQQPLRASAATYSSLTSVNKLAGMRPSLRIGEKLLVQYQRNVHLAGTAPTNTANNPATATGQPAAPASANANTSAANAKPSPPDAAAASAPATAANTLAALQQRIASCTACKLHERRKHAVTRNHRPTLPIIIVSDIMNWSDQLQGRLFTTADGQLLLKIISALGLDANNVYITTAVKCSAVEELSNQLDALNVCLQYFHSEVKLIKPQLIIAFGENTYRLLSGKKAFSTSQGQLLPYENSQILYTEHPRELINDPTLKKTVWEHLKPLGDFIQKLKQTHA